MSRNEFDMAHEDCPVALRTVKWRSDGRLVCPECKTIIVSRPVEFDKLVLTPDNLESRKED